MIAELFSKTTEVDFKSNQITFLDGRFYRSENGNHVPSVTTILDAYPKGAEYYAWLKRVGEDADMIRDEAGRRGSKVHQLTEEYDAGVKIDLLDENGYPVCKMSEWAMFERYVEFRNRFKFEVMHNEFNVVSEKLGFAGTIDRVIQMGEDVILLDIKTSNTIYPSYWLQLAAYEQLIAESYGYNPITKVGVIWLNAKTRTDGTKGAIQGPGWQMIIKDDSTKDWQLFQATQQLWLAENGNMKPREFTYQLSHSLTIKQ